VLLLTVFFGSATSFKDFHWQTLGKMSHFVKRAAPGMFLGGRLSERQIGYIAEANFSSIFSLVNFPTDDAVYHGISDTWPSTVNEGKISGSYGLSYQAVAIKNLSTDTFYEVSDMLTRIPKPVLVHCSDNYGAAIMAQLHLVRVGAAFGGDIYNAGKAMGFDYQADEAAVDLISSITGYVLPVTKTPSIDLRLTNGEQSYKDYYWTHRMGSSDMWYNMGQPLSNHVDNIINDGYKVIINFRADGEATNKLPSEMTNQPIPNNEFSDENGLYDLGLETSTWMAKTPNVEYYSLPVTTWTKEVFMSYVPHLDAAVTTATNSNGAILAHCASGYRSSGFVLTYMAYKQGFCTEWVLSEARKIGYSFDLLSADQQVVQFSRSVLGC